MLNRPFTTPRALSIRPALTFCLGTCLLLSVVWHFRGVRPEAVRPARGVAERAAQIEVGGDGVEQGALPKLEGEAARAYLERTSDGQSLMKVLTAERFGLKRQGRSPFDEKSGAGYLGMSHDQNLNAWFDEGGVTVRPTLSENERDRAWRLGFRLKSYGYGSQLTAAPPVVSHRVKDNRIEYERGGAAGASIVEWYENQSAGIEQGFTLSARPAVRGAGVGVAEYLRLVMAVTGDLRARAKDEGEAIELSKKNGEGVLSYSHLTALDATGRKLVARMETNDEGDEIALVVDDREAVYPVVIYPITATLEKALDAGGNRQADARFGFAVAIDNDTAVVGAWREDVPFSALVDAGAVYIFTRSGSVWSSATLLYIGDVANASCGWSVATYAVRVAFGCPGANSQTGRAFLRQISPPISNEINQPVGFKGAGDQFGYSIALSNDTIVVGAPYSSRHYSQGGTAEIFDIGANSTPVYRSEEFGITNMHTGYSIAVEGNVLLVGCPNADTSSFSSTGFVSMAGEVRALYRNSAGNWIIGQFINASDPQTGDEFGESIALSGHTMVVGAHGDDDRGTDAGAAYVFVSASNGHWTQQQKLTAFDGGAGDHFSMHAVAIEGSMIAVGADAWDVTASDDNAGAVYVYTRSGTVWTAQRQSQSAALAANYGISVDISGETLMIGARAADASGTSRAGAAYVYHLGCTPPSGSSAGTSPTTVCPGSTVTFGATATYYGSGSPLTIQWRKNGVNIPGATDATYTINAATAADAGSYDVILANACGSDISPPVMLDIHRFTIYPDSQNISASGSSGIINVTATGNCSRTAVSNASWIFIDSGASGSGSGNVSFTVVPNTGAGQRTGTITIAGQTFTITQDGTAPASNTFQFSQSIYSTSEGAGSVAITVTRSGDVSAPATVEYATTDGTATDRGDYNTTIGRLRFAAGESAKAFSVLVTDDAYAEGTESLNLTLSNPTGGPALGPPSIASLSINDNDAVTSGSNPIDATPFFVHQQYVDFFSREPDAGGLAFWSGGIDSCGSDAGCREVKRVDTSAAFFLSIEFQETGFLAHRLYRAAFGRLARYREFVRDTQEIGRGVVVNSPGWEAQLEANKVAFLNEFAARADFQALYAGMTNAQYVDALNANAAGPLSQAERDALISGLTGGSETRASVLRKVADAADLRARETSPAFVLMQYFGYLRRNPDDAPDSDFAGYNFWLGKLNEFGGDYRRAEMVRAFLVSTEYRRRFGL